METIKSPAEQKVILHNVRWETYERLMQERGESRVPRFAYDRGELEIMSPQAEHESIKINRTIHLLVELLAEEFEVDLENRGSATFKREDLKRGFEPHSCFYIQNEEQVRGKADLDLNVDPPPDLVIEIDITSPSLPRFPIYARFGVPEVGRYDGERVLVYGLREAEYVELSQSVALPILTSAVVTRFVRDGLTTRSRAWTRKVREWARNRAGFSD